MVILSLTKTGFETMHSLIKEKHIPVWINDDVLSESELKKYREAGMNITNFSYHIGSGDDEALNNALATIELHHPGMTIWIEHLPGT